MRRVKVSDYIADFFAGKGVSDVFTITGGGAMHLNNSFGHHPRLRCTYNHHEQACSIAAEGYAKLTGRIPVVCVTSGPGGTNAITGVLGAWVDSVPMFIVSGQVKISTTVSHSGLPLRQLGDQEFDITKCVSTMTKYSVMVTDANTIAYHLERAYHICHEGRKGPVWLDIPLDIQGAVVDEDDLAHFVPADEPKLSADDGLIDEMLERVRSAKRPVILAGSAISLSDSREKFLTMIDKLNIPVVTAWTALDVLWNDHPLYCGRPGTVGTRGGNFVVQNSDLLISFGCRLNIRQISYNWENFACNAYKIIIDIDKAELEKPTIAPDMAINADVSDVIDKLAARCGAADGRHSKWLDWCRKIDARYPAVRDEFLAKDSPVNPYVFMDRFFDCLREGDVVAASNGSACVISFQAARLKKGQRLFTNSGCASMGYGLSAAIGAAVSQNGKMIFCLEGDGSIQMNLQELQTAAHNNLNVKIIWLNNSGYHSIRQTQANLFGGALCGVSADNGVSFPSAEKIAGAYGINYLRINAHREIEGTINRLVSFDGPAICEVVLDPEQFFEPKLSSKLLPDGKMVSSPLDDMYPFLDEREYESVKKVLVNDYE